MEDNNKLFNDVTALHDRILTGGLVNMSELPDKRLELPEINTSEFMTAPTVDRKQLEINNLSSQDAAKANLNWFANIEKLTPDPNKFAKIYSYNSGHQGYNFNRYVQVPRVYKAIGFSPWRDNEKLYNEKITGFEDFTRAAVNSAYLAGSSFQSMLPWKANPIFGDGEMTDLESASKSEQYNMQGSSSKHGLTGFVNNLTLNMGFMNGMALEFGTEQLLTYLGGIALAPFTEGGSLAVAGANTISDINKAATLLKAGKTIENLGKLTLDSEKLLNGAKNITKARQFFNVLKEGTATNKALQVILPNTGTFATDLYTDYKKGKDILTLAKASKGVGSFYRDSREIAMALSEAKTEGGSAQLDLEHKLVNEYQDSHDGHLPGEDEMYRISTAARRAGEATYLKNIPMLLISNKLVFDKMLNGSNVMRMFNKNIIDGRTAKVIFQEGKEGLRGTWKTVDKGLRQDIKSIFTKDTWVAKNLAKRIGGGLINYTKANFVEGAQEMFQDAASDASKRYEESLYKDPLHASLYNPWANMYNSSVRQFTTSQGWETFASGFFMAGLAHGPQHLIYERAIPKFESLINKKESLKYKEQEKKNMVSLENAMNELTKNPKIFLDENMSNILRQNKHDKDLADISESEDIKAIKDKLDEGLLDHIYTVIKTGHLDTFIDHLYDMKTMNSKELKEAFGSVEEGEIDLKDAYGKKIDKVIGNAQRLQKEYNKINNKYTNPFDYSSLSYKKNPEEFEQMVYFHEGYEEAKKLALFAGENYLRALDRITDISKDLSSNSAAANIKANDITTLFNSENINNEIDNLKKEVETYSKGTGDDKRTANKKDKTLETLKIFKDNLDLYVAAYKTEFKKEGTSGLGSMHKDLYNSYLKYLNSVKDSNLGIMNNKFIKDSFYKIRDMHLLKDDSMYYSSLVNELENPDYFMEHVRRNADRNEFIHKNRLEYFKEAIKKYHDNLKLNKLLNDLLGIDIVFDAEELELFTQGIMPKTFHYVSNGNIVEHSSKKYKEIIIMLEGYENISDITFMNKGISNVESEDYRGFSIFSRKKHSKDYRTYKDLAIQFGFNPEIEESEVKLVSVLQSIIDSEYSNYREKALARKLLEITSKDQVIKFRKEHGKAGTYDETNGIIVNAQFSSNDYRGGYVPLETTILHQQIHKLTDNALETDSEFKEEISKLLSIAKAEFNDKNGKEKFSKIPFLGLKSESEFIAEVMTNERFKLFLQSIYYKTNGKTMWDELLSTIRILFKKIFWNTEENTVLNEALYIITAKIDNENGVKEKQKASKATEIVQKETFIQNEDIDNESITEEIVPIENTIKMITQDMIDILTSKEYGYTMSEVNMLSYDHANNIIKNKRTKDAISKELNKNKEEDIEKELERQQMLEEMKDLMMSFNTYDVFMDFYNQILNEEISKLENRYGLIKEDLVKFLDEELSRYKNNARFDNLTIGEAVLYNNKRYVIEHKTKDTIELREFGNKAQTIEISKDTFDNNVTARVINDEHIKVINEKDYNDINNITNDDIKALEGTEDISDSFENSLDVEMDELMDDLNCE